VSSNSVPHTIILPPYARFPAPQCGDWGKLLRYYTPSVKFSHFSSVLSGNQA